MTSSVGGCREVKQDRTKKRQFDLALITLGFLFSDEVGSQMARISSERRASG